MGEDRRRFGFDLNDLPDDGLILCLMGPQVVLPLPGYNVEYPNNEIKDWYAELLEADGLSFNALKHEIK